MQALHSGQVTQCWLPLAFTGIYIHLCLLLMPTAGQSLEMTQRAPAL